MGQESNQFDISGIQLRESKTQPRVSLSREIGEAQIVHTIFGKAKVRIIRKNDKLHRTLWLVAAVVVSAVAGIVWQGWFATQQIEPVQSTDLMLPATSEVQASSAASQVMNTAAGDVAAPVAVHTLKREGGASAVPAINGPVVVQKSVTQQPPAIKEAGTVVAKPVVMQPKPAAVQPAPVATLPATTGLQQRVTPSASSSVTNAATMGDKPQPARLMPSRPTVAPAAGASAAKTTAVPLAASSPGTAVSPGATLNKDANSTELPAGDNQLSSPINSQSK